MKSLFGKKILITGATGGFGQEFAKQLHGLGAHLILSGRDKSKLDSISGHLGSSNAGGRIIGLINANLSDKKGCEELHNRCLEITPDIDILINNAGIIAYGDFQEVPQDKWEQLMEINLLSTMRLTYMFLPAMLKKKQGHIVLMSSVAGFIGTKNSTVYAASKFGIRGFGLSLYEEVHHKGIHVTILYPFWADTPLLQSEDYGGKSTKKVIKIVVDKADHVIKESIKGIRRNKLSVYPGPTAKVLHFLSKFVQIRGSQRKG
jgi:short-subunit dehydrogenase